MPVRAAFQALLSEVRAQFSIAERAMCCQAGNLLQLDWQHAFLVIGEFAETEALKSGPIWNDLLCRRPEFFESRLDE